MEQPGVIEISTSTFGEREIVSNLTIILVDPSKIFLKLENYNQKYFLNPKTNYN